MARKDVTEGLKEAKNRKEHPITGDVDREDMSKSNINIKKTRKDIRDEDLEREVFPNKG